MKQLFFALCAFLIALCSYGQAVEPEQPDTIRGIAILIQPGGTMTLDTMNDQVKFITTDEGILIPVRAFCVRTPIEIVPASMRGNSVGYVTRFYRISTGAEIPQNDVMMFKIRDDDRKK